MKYKKLLLIMTLLLFVTVAVFCFASAFKITDIELNVTEISGSSENVKDLCEENLVKYKDQNLVFVNTDSISKELSSLSGYIKVDKVEKNFPNKLSITVKEVSEAFVISNGVNYYALDSEFNVLTKKTTIKNNVDGIDNILLDLALSDFNTTIVPGQKLQVFDSETNNYLNLCANKLYLIRSNLSSISVTVRKDGYDYKTLTLTMREGVKFTVLKSNENILQKIDVLVEFYNALDNKGSGSYSVVTNDNGEITVKK